MQKGAHRECLGLLLYTAITDRWSRWMSLDNCKKMLLYLCTYYRSDFFCYCLLLSLSLFGFLLHIRSMMCIKVCKHYWNVKKINIKIWLWKWVKKTKKNKGGGGVHFAGCFKENSCLCFLRLYLSLMKVLLLNNQKCKNRADYLMVLGFS